jgi:hypothetical protein
MRNVRDLKAHSRHTSRVFTTLHDPQRYYDVYTFIDLTYVQYLHTHYSHKKPYMFYFITGVLGKPFKIGKLTWIIQGYSK